MLDGDWSSDVCSSDLDNGYWTVGERIGSAWSAGKALK
jgi:hypothetical protein